MRAIALERVSEDLVFESVDFEAELSTLMESGRCSVSRHFCVDMQINKL